MTEEIWGKEKPVKEKKITEDFITRFVNICSKYCDSPEVFIEAGGYHIVASLLGRYFKSKWLPKPGRPNLWFICSSIPGRMRRSSVYGFVEFVYKKVLEKMTKERFLEENKQLPDDKKIKINKELIQSVIEDGIIEEGSPEGVMDHIDQTELECYAIMSTEFGVVLLRMGGEHYESGVGTLFSKLAYGEGGSMFLSRRGGAKGKRKIPPGLYVTMFCGMQEPKWYLSKKMIRQGLLRRILIIYVPKSMRYKPPIVIGREQVWFELKQLFEDLVVKVKIIEEKLGETGQELIRVRFKPSVYEEINKFDESFATKVDENPTDVNLYKQSFWEHLTKLTMCKAIADDNCKLHYDEGLSEYYILVKENHLQAAKKFFNKATGNCDECIQELGAKSETVRTKEDPLEMVYGHIERSMPTGILYSKLLTKTKLLTSELGQYLLTLGAQHRIIEVKEETKGRPRRVLKVKGWNV